jgi:hypothetical protein
MRLRDPQRTQLGRNARRTTVGGRQDGVSTAHTLDDLYRISDDTGRLLMCDGLFVRKARMKSSCFTPHLAPMIFIRKAHGTAR